MKEEVGGNAKRNPGQVDKCLESFSCRGYWKSGKEEQKRVTCSLRFYILPLDWNDIHNFDDIEDVGDVGDV